MVDGAQSLSRADVNKGTAFTREERLRLGLEGLLPPRVESLQEQVARIVENLRGTASPLEKYRYLSAVQADNETLFYRVIHDVALAARRSRPWPTIRGMRRVLARPISQRKRLA